MLFRCFINQVTLFNKTILFQLRLKTGVWSTSKVRSFHFQEVTTLPSFLHQPPLPVVSSFCYPSRWGPSLLSVSNRDIEVTRWVQEGKVLYSLIGLLGTLVIVTNIRGHSVSWLLEEIMITSTSTVHGVPPWCYVNPVLS